MWGLYLGREDGRANVEDVQKGVIWRASPTPPPTTGRDAQPYERQHEARGDERARPQD